MDDGKMDGAVEEPKPVVEGEMPVEPAVEGEDADKKDEMPDGEEKKPEEGEAPKSW